MTTIYVVTSGDYSDYSINAMFETKQEAEAFIDFQVEHGHNYHHNDEEIWAVGGGYWGRQDYSIEEWELGFTTPAETFKFKAASISVDPLGDSNRLIVRPSALTVEFAKQIKMEDVLVSARIRDGGTAMSVRRFHDRNVRLTFVAEDGRILRRYMRDTFARHIAEYEQVGESFLTRKMKRDADDD